MRWAKYGYIAGGVLSVAVHVFAFGGLSAMKKANLGSQHVAVMMSSAKKKAKPKPPEPPKPIEAPKEMLSHPLAPAKAAPSLVQSASAEHCFELVSMITEHESAAAPRAASSSATRAPRAFRN